MGGGGIRRKYALPRAHAWIYKQTNHLDYLERFYTFIWGKLWKIELSVWRGKKKIEGNEGTKKGRGSGAGLTGVDGVFFVQDRAEHLYRQSFPSPEHSHKRLWCCQISSIVCITLSSEVGIYKRKQKSKKTRIKERKEELDRECVKKKKVFFLFSWSLSWSSSCFLDRFLGRVLVFLFSYFLVFFYKFPPQDTLSAPRSDRRSTNIQLL